MKRQIFILLLLFFCARFSFAQNDNVGIGTNTPHASSLLHMKSTEKGLLIPKMTSTQREAIDSPANGLLVFDTSTNSFWYRSLTDWIDIKSFDKWEKISNNLAYTNGNIGIGSSPAFDAKLHIRSTELVDGIKLDGGGSTQKIGLHLNAESNGGNEFRIESTGQTASVGGKKLLFRDKTESKNRMVIDEFGNVGIGLESPSSKLNVLSNKLLGGITVEGGNNNQKIGIYLNAETNGGKEYRIESTGQTASEGNQKLVFRDHSAAENRMVIDGNGNVGIGFENPTAELQVANELRVEDDNGGGLLFLKGNGDAEIQMYNSDTDKNVHIYSDFFGLGGTIILKDDNNVNSNAVTIAANHLNSGYSRIIIDELQIRGGSDFAELFDVNGDNIKPGMLVSIDENRMGELQISDQIYDHKIVGIISGANGIRPGMMMSQQSTEADGQYPIAISGRVYALASNENGVIQAGDLLVSNGKGFVMKSDHYKPGTVIGKSMSAITPEGFVFVLVNLQ